MIRMHLTLMKKLFFLAKPRQHSYMILYSTYLKSLSQTF